MQKIWILIADAQRARYFERNLSDHTLTELADFVHPVSTLPQRTHQTHASHTSEDTGKGHGRTGHAGTQFEPHTETQDKERRNFARQLADYLNTEVAEQRCTALVLIAPAPVLGDVKPLLSHAASKIVHTTIDKDLTHYSGNELKQRVEAAMA